MLELTSSALLKKQSGPHATEASHMEGACMGRSGDMSSTVSGRIVAQCELTTESNVRCRCPPASVATITTVRGCITCLLTTIPDQRAGWMANQCDGNGKVRCSASSGDEVRLA